MSLEPECPVPYRDGRGGRLKSVEYPVHIDVVERKSEQSPAEIQTTYDERDLHVEDGMYAGIMDRVEDETDELTIVH